MRMLCWLVQGYGMRGILLGMKELALESERSEPLRVRDGRPSEGPINSS